MRVWRVGLCCFFTVTFSVRSGATEVRDASDPKAAAATLREPREEQSLERAKAKYPKWLRVFGLGEVGKESPPNTAQGNPDVEVF